MENKLKNSAGDAVEELSIPDLIERFCEKTGISEEDATKEIARKTYVDTLYGSQPTHLMLVDGPGHKTGIRVASATPQRPIDRIVVEFMDRRATSPSSPYAVHAVASLMVENRHPLHLDNFSVVELLMRHSPSGPLIEAFVMEALWRYTESVVKAGPEKLESPLLSGQAWCACAEQTQRLIAFHFGKPKTEATFPESNATTGT